MSEDTEHVAPSAGPASVSGAVWGSLGAASRKQADAFLQEQILLARAQVRLTDLQAENLAELNAYELSHLRWRRFGEQVKGAMQIALIAAIVLGLTFVGATMWSASRAKGLVVETFSVPPAYAASGMTGEMLAQDLTNAVGRIRDIGDAASLVRSDEVRQENADDIRVEIPETGTSVGQAWRAMRLWLGHERRLGGNLRTAPDGTVALTVALEGARAFTLTGPAADLPKLEQLAAERVFETVDNNNYVIALLNQGRLDDCMAAVQRYAERKLPTREHAAAVSLWGGMSRVCGGNLGAALMHARAAAKIDPKLVLPQYEIMWASIGLGHDEELLRVAKTIPTYEVRYQTLDIRGLPYRQILETAAYQRAYMTGDFAAAPAGYCGGCTPQAVFRAEVAGRLHDAAAGRALLAEGIGSGPFYPDIANQARYHVDVAAEDWPAAVADARALNAPQSGVRFLGADMSRLSLPMLGYALARSGDIAEAERVVQDLPDDCYPCLRARGRIAATKGDSTAADSWFAKAIAFGPSLPFAYAERGEMLLGKGDPDAAIAQLMLANQRGPRYADALELWGEALTAKGRPDLADAKFAAAARLAPNWGRLHLKWGEALAKAGEADKARVQLKTAGLLVLSPQDRVELGAAAH